MLQKLVEGIQASVKRIADAWGLKHSALLLCIVVAASVGFSSTVFATPTASAVERVMLGHAQGIALAQNADPAAGIELDMLRGKAAEAGTVRVIVDTSAAAAWNTASCGSVVTTAMPTLSPQPATFPPSATANPCHGRSMA